MGCGASGGQPAEPAQQERMCQEATKMMTSCVAVHVISEANDKIKIVAPTHEVKQLHETANSLREAAEECKSKAADLTEGAKAGAAAAADKASGMMGAMGGVLSKAADLAGAAAGGAASAGAAVIEKGLLTVADALEAPAKKLDDQFSTIARELFAKKQTEIQDVYMNILEKVTFDKATQLVRGDNLEYETCPSDRVSTGFMGLARADLKEKLAPAVRPEVEQMAAVKTWVSCIESYQQANEKFGQFEWAEKFKRPKITLDIHEYIVEALLDRVAAVMGQHEAEVRKRPSGRAVQRPVTFELCFSSRMLSQKAWQDYTNGL